MRATFTQDQVDIQATVRSLVQGGLTAARLALDEGWSAPACDTVLLRDFSQLGVPEAAGGVGSDLIDLLVAVEMIGETVMPSRFPAHAAAVQLLADTGAVPADVLEGNRVLSIAADAPGFSGWADRGGSDPRMRTLVRYAGEADAIVALGAEGVWLAGPSDIVSRASLDPGVPLSDVVVGPPEGPAGGRCGVHRATLVAAAELCGVAQGAIDLAGAYARSREQFGRPIGSFQAIAFQLAESLTQRKAAWDLTLYAAWAVQHGRPDAEIQVHAAKAAAGKAAVFAAERCIQVHGGMGITMEADPHLFLRRAFVLDASLGRGSWHRRRVGDLRISNRKAPYPV